MKNHSLIIGLTGTSGAGKGTVASYLKQKGFVYYSCSDILREELKQRGIEDTRDNLQALGNQIREKFGYGELAKRLLKKIIKNKEQKAIVDSIRHPKEIEELQKNKNFYLIALDAPIKLRYKRIKTRLRNGDNVTFEKFKEQEKKEMAEKGAGQQIGVCLKLADYKIINNGSFNELYKKLNICLKRLNIRI